MRRAVLAAVLALVATVAPAAVADPLDLPNTPASIEVPSGWTRFDVPGVVAAFRGPHGVVAAVTRAPVANPDAWRSKTRAAYLARIERGAVAASPGQRVVKRHAGTVGRVPALDLELRRADGTRVVIRVLAYRTHTIAVAVAAPPDASIDAARAFAGGLVPPPRRHP